MMKRTGDMGVKNARHRISCVVTFIVGAAVSGVAHAQMTENTVKVGVRVASFLHTGLSGSVTAAIIYEPGNDASEREARTIERELGGRPIVGSLQLRPRRVASNALAELAGARIAFVTKGTNYREIASETASRSMLTITSDPACTRAGYCTVAIQSSPRVQIFVSRAACGAARIRFSAAFLMLVREI